MLRTYSDYELLLQFEKFRKRNDKPIRYFLDARNLKHAPQLQLDLVALDMEIHLTRGERYDVDDFYFEFPHLIEQVSTVDQQVKKEFLRTFCPIKDRLGELPFSMPNYIIEREISRGGMGVVYLAHRVSDAKPCAVKFLYFKPDLLVTEAKLLEQIDHENVCKLLDFGTIDEFPFLCMELIRGDSLRTILDTRGHFQPHEAATIIHKLASGLEKVHGKGIVHFDINSKNILFHLSGEPILTDFGLAAFYDENERMTITFGTPEYMAPEILDSRFGNPGMVSDVYGLGVVLYEMLTGHRPFAVKSGDGVEQVCKYPPSRPSDFEGRFIDPAMENICLRMLEKHVTKRTLSMSHIKKQLTNWSTQFRTSCDPTQVTKLKKQFEL